MAVSVQLKFMRHPLLCQRFPHALFLRRSFLRWSFLRKLCAYKRLPKTAAMIALCISTLLTGCSTVSNGVDKLLEPDPTLLELEIETGYNINPNRKGEGAPLVVRIYELSEDEPFQQARFIDLFQQGDDLLQGSLVKRHLLPALLPGRRTRLSYALADNTRYIAVLAEFASYEKAQTHAVAAVTPNVTNQGLLTIEGLNMNLNIPQPGGVLDNFISPSSQDIQDATSVGKQLSRDNE